jgi:hypothetical protein
MHEQIYSLWDIVQLLFTIFACWFCYRCGRNEGIVAAGEYFGAFEDEDDDENGTHA